MPAEVEIPITTSSTLPTSEIFCVTQLEAENAKLCAHVAYLSSDIAHAEAIQRGAAQGRLQDARKHLEDRHKVKYRVKQNSTGDVTIEEAQEAILLQQHCKDLAARKLAVKTTKQQREQIVADALVAATIMQTSET